ncbi:MAG: PAS domain S-box protein [Anaerolineales bacterium]|jgi:PAS domain S-box-containing protein
MSDKLFELGSGPAFERLKELTSRADKLPPESRELVDELVEAYTVSVEELQVAAEELNQQNDELMAAREEIENQHQRYHEMFEFAPDGYLVTSPTGIIRELNHAAVELLGISRSNLIDKPMVLYVSTEERDRFHLHLDRLIESQGVDAGKREWEMRFKSGQGREFPAALTVAPIKDKQDELTGLRWLLRDITDSKRAEEREHLLAQVREQNAAALEANRLLHALIETMPVGALIADADGMFLLTNTAGREILGTRVSGDIKSPQMDFTTYYPDGTPFPRVEMPLMRAIQEKELVKDVEVLVRRADGVERSILASAAPILDDRREVLSGITVFQDITERKKSRIALRRYAERLNVLRQADLIILEAGALDELVESVLPFTRELVPYRVAGVFSFDWEANQAVVLGVLANGKTQLGEENYSFPVDDSWPLEELARGEMAVLEIDSLSTLPVLVDALKAADVLFLKAVPLLAQDELLGVLFLGCEEQIDLEAGQHEIIDQMANELAIGILQVRQREQLQRYAAQLERKVTRRTGALRESEERFRIILDAAVFGIALLDTKGRIVQSNPALQTMTGYSKNELHGMTFSGYSHPDDSQADQDLYRALASGETGHYQVEKRFVRKDGQVRWSELTVSRVRQTQGGKPWLAVAVMADITEKKKIRESLARTERLTLAGRLGASLAHEINNPVQAVIGCLGLAEEMLEGDGDVRRYLDIAMQELERTAGIVAQLRDLGRESAPQEKVPTDLNVFVENVLLLTRKRSQNQGIEVEWQPAADLPTIALAPDGMQQVLLNLVLNAVEAMEAGGRLQVSTCLVSQPQGVNITFSDTGVGIEPERLYQVFDPFHSSRAEGLGLGLFISRKIVEEHGGRIEAESVVGEGSTFTVWLPI